MPRRMLACIAALAYVSFARGAEIFYLDHDSMSNEYTGPVGPLVLSGDIEPGDYSRLLAKIAEDKDRFLTEHRLMIAVSDGEVAESIKIADLVRATFIEVVVGPLTGRCAGVCFLIYAAASERATDGDHLLAVYRPDALPGEDPSGRVRAYLEQNAVPAYLIEQALRHGAVDQYVLSRQDEEALASKSPAFAQLLAAKCGWSEAIEHAVNKGERPMADLAALSLCKERLTRPAARNVLDAALANAGIHRSDAAPRR